MATELAGSVLDPAVSIILPTYNRADLLGRSIRSVLAQGYGAFELIVVDDGSTDETACVMAGFRDRRVKYLKLERNTGAGAARNAGIRASRGKFLAFQDSDDEWSPSKLAKQMSAFGRGPARLGVVYSDMQRISSEGGASYFAAPRVIPNRLIDRDARFYQVGNLGIQSAVIKREYMEEAGHFNEGLPALEDLELFIRLSRICDFHHIREPLVKYYDTQGVSKDFYAVWTGRRLILKLYYKELLIRAPAFSMREALRLCLTSRKAALARHTPHS